MGSIINLTIKSDFKQASADLKKFEVQSESTRKSIEKFQKGFKEESIKKFNDRLARSTAAVKATRGPLAALTHEHRALQRQIESLIKKGLDPEGKEVKDLASRYQKLEKELKDVNAQQKKNLKTSKATEGALLAIGAGAVVMGKRAVGAFIELSKESAQAASDAEEIGSKYQVVFKDIADEAAGAAAAIASEFDLAASTVNKLLGDSGDILTGLGFDQETALELSTAAGRLAIDLASFTNFAGGAEGASAALTKAMLGEAESAKALGIVIRQDTVEYKAMIAEIMEAEKVGLVQAKALAALRIATEQSKNAIGDYARTAESSANTTRRLAESQKELKEAFGVSINEGLTPFKAALADITKEYADFIDKQNEATAFTKDFRDGIIDEERTLEELNKTLAGLEDTRNQYGLYSKDVRENITAVKALIDAFAAQDAWMIQIADSADVAGRVEADAAAKISAGLEKSKEALARFLELKESQLTSTEKQVQALSAEIAEWVKFRDIAGVQQTINELVSQRNILLEEEAAKVQSLADKETEKAEKEAERLRTESENRIIALDAMFQGEIDFREQQELLAQEYDMAEAQRVEARKQMYISFAGSVLSSMSTALSSIDNLQSAASKREVTRIDNELDAQIAALKGEVDTRTETQKQIAALEEEAAKKKAEIEYKSAIVSWGLQLAGAIATGAQAILAGFASQPFLPVGLAMGALATGIAGTQIGAVAASKPQKPSFQTGTGIVPFTVPENNQSSRADSQSFSASPGEEVRVTPRGESQTGIMNAVFKIGEQEMYRFINVGIESGDIVISQDNIQGGQAV